MKKYTLLLCAVILALSLASCGSTETETTAETESDTTSSETVAETEAETETETESETEPVFIRHDDLTATECTFDTTTGSVTVRFDDPYVIFEAGDPCEASLSGGGAAYLLEGTIDMDASAAMQTEDGFYTGAVVKLVAEDPIEAGEYKMILQFSSYSVTTTVTLDKAIG